MQSFKTLWCPYGAQHDWHSCMYAHSYQDWRRRPELGYDSDPCPHWAKNSTQAIYHERCPNGFACPLSHGSKEQLYHPLHYKTQPCTDWAASGRCPRGHLCAFHHGVEQRREVAPRKTAWRSLLPDVVATLEALQPGFRRPPLFSLETPDAPSECSALASTPRGAFSTPPISAMLAPSAIELPHCALPRAKTSFNSLASVSTGSSPLNPPAPEPTGAPLSAVPVPPTLGTWGEALVPSALAGSSNPMGTIDLGMARLDWFLAQQAGPISEGAMQDLVSGFRAWGLSAAATLPLHLGAPVAERSPAYIHSSLASFGAVGRLEGPPSRATGLRRDAPPRPVQISSVDMHMLL
mmetsp:Transcript_5719/g.21690  ORF Transcript_5719/g.21690 Transcript_5719/m.21690 type:complete len:350 (-) Transcript_5719:187-1236(-)